MGPECTGAIVWLRLYTGLIGGARPPISFSVVVVLGDCSYTDYSLLEFVAFRTESIKFRGKSGPALGGIRSTG